MVKTITFLISFINQCSFKMTFKVSFIPKIFFEMVTLYYCHFSLILLFFLKFIHVRFWRQLWRESTTQEFQGRSPAGALGLTSSRIVFVLLVPRGAIVTSTVHIVRLLVFLITHFSITLVHDKITTAIQRCIIGTFKKQI